MLKDITKIKLSGGIFDTLISFDFFNPKEGGNLKTVKGALVYGRNGSGKSTIAKAFRKLSGEDIPINAMVYDKEEQVLHLRDEDKKRIFIFDEDYVDKNVRLQEDHLNTIVMLGEAVDLTEKIEEASLECNKRETAYRQQEAKMQEYCDSSNVKSPKYYLNRMVNALRGDDNWAGRDKEINGNRQNTAVRDDTYKRFVSLMPKKSRTDLIAEYGIKIKELEVAKTGEATIDKEVPEISNVYRNLNEKIICRLLAEKIEKPQLSNREKKLFELLQAGKGNDLSEKLEYFQDENVIECPFCLQSINKEYRKSLVKSIEKVLSKIVEEHQRELQENLLKHVDIDLNPYEKLNGYQTCVELIEKINVAIDEYNVNLNKKIANPYEPIIIKNYIVQNLANQLYDALVNLEKMRKEYNNDTRKTEPIINALNRINAEIAHYDVADFANQYEKQQKEYMNETKGCTRLKNEYDKKKREVEELEARRGNVRLAVEAINYCLKYIFFAENRLKIEYIDGAYKLLSHGKSVKPCDVSSGERNAIGLSYFFTSVVV